MTEPFARLEVRRYRPKRRRTYGDHRVIETLYLRLRDRASSDRRTLASLSPVPLVRVSNGAGPVPLPADRARAWDELAQWICYYVIYPDPAVQDGQYQNRLRWQQWAHRGAERPSADDLYDWRRDESTVARLRPHYRSVAEKLIEAIGAPSRADAAALHPNPFEDEGLSDDARRLLRDLRAVFGRELVQN